MSEKRILVTRSSMPPFEEFENEIKPLWDSAWLTNFGTLHMSLKKELEKYLDVPMVSLFVNGHSALEMSLQALGLKGEVITTPFTFASTTHAIVRNGLKPVFCDIDRDDYTIDVSSIESLITKDTCAIVPVHVYGNICRVYDIEEIARKHGLAVIYDAAHTFGEKIDNKGVCSFGDASILSFHATKVFNTIEGGAVCLKDQNLFDRLHSLKDFGIIDEENIDGVGANAKMNEFQAAMGLCNLRHVDGEIEKRRTIVERYREGFEGVKGLKLNKIQKNVRSNYAYFPLVFDDDFRCSRDRVVEELKSENIFARKYFWPITSTFACYKEMFSAAETPTAMDISSRVITVPLYADLDISEVDRICRIIREGVKL